MRCSVCGKELPENSAFCDYCGNPELISEPQASSHRSAAPRKRVPPSQRRKKKQQAVRNVSRIALILVAVLLLSTVVWNLPIVQIPLAGYRSAQELAAVLEKVSKIAAPLYNNPAYSTSTLIGFRNLKDFQGEEELLQWSQFDGAVIQLNGQMSEFDRLYSGGLTLSHAGAELLRAEYGLDYDTAWLRAPALLSNTYGIYVYDECEPLKSLEALGIDIGLLSGLKLNFFNAPTPEVLPTTPPEPTEPPTEPSVPPTPPPTEPSVPPTPPPTEPSVPPTQPPTAPPTQPPTVPPTTPPTVPPTTPPATEPPTAPTVPELDIWELVSATRFGFLGWEKLQINGNTLTCTGYSITLKEESLQDGAIQYYFDMLAQAVGSLYSSLGKPAAAPVITAPGDLTVDVYIQGGYIVSMVCHLEMNGAPFEVSVNIGGTDTYINGISMTMDAAAGPDVALSAIGSHTGHADAYTTTLTQVTTNGSQKSGFSANLTYLPLVENYNFGCDLTVLEAGTGTVHTLKGSGQLEFEGKHLSLDMKQVDWNINGKDQATVNFRHEIGDYSKAEEAPTVSPVNKLTEAGIKRVQKDLLVNCQELVFKLMKDYPMLKDIILDQMMDAFG